MAFGSSIPILNSLDRTTLVEYNEFTSDHDLSHVSQIRMIIDKFGLAAVKNSWYDSKKVTERVLHGYTKVNISTACDLNSEKG